MHLWRGRMPLVSAVTPLPLARMILANLTTEQLAAENARARAAGLSFDAYVERRMEELKAAPRSHIYLAQLRASRMTRSR